MGASDRLYEVACEVRDLETKEDRLVLDAHHLKEELDAQHRAVAELVEALEDDRLGGLLPAFSDRVASALSGLQVTQ